MAYIVPALIAENSGTITVVNWTRNEARSAGILCNPMTCNPLPNE
jgi:hypothetical protein